MKTKATQTAESKKVMEVTFSPKQADGTVILYQPTTGGPALTSEETLSLTLKNAGQDEITFNEDSALLLYISEPQQFTKEELETFRLSYDYQPAQEKDAPWTLEVLDQDHDDFPGYNALRLKPDEPFSLAGEASVVLTLTDFRGTRNLKPRDLELEMQDIPGAHSHSGLLVVKQSQKGLPLKLRLTPLGSNTVYVSPSGIDPPKNTLGFSLENADPLRHKQPIGATNDTKIKLSFDYADDTHDKHVTVSPSQIAKATDAKNYGLTFLETYDTDYKGPVKKGVDVHNPYWELRPQNGVLLGADANSRLDLKFSDLTARTPGIATLHAECFDAKDRLDGYCSMDIIKTLPTFSILHFGAAEVLLTAEDPKVRLTWEVVAASYATLQFKKYGELQTLSTNGEDDLSTRFKEKEPELPPPPRISLLQTNLKLRIYQDTLFTLSAYKGEEPVLSDQRQLLVSVVPALEQFAESCCYDEFDKPVRAVSRCCDRYRLDTDDDLQMYALAQALASAGYDNTDLRQAILGFAEERQGAQWTDTRKDQLRWVVNRALSGKPITVPKA